MILTKNLPQLQSKFHATWQTFIILLLPGEWLQPTNTSQKNYTTIVDYIDSKRYDIPSSLPSLFFLYHSDLLPDKPTNLTATEVGSTYLKISWIDPQNTGVKLGTNISNPLTGYRFIVMNSTVDKNVLQVFELNIRNKPFKLKNLMSYTTYIVNVSAGNSEGFGMSTIATFTTAKEG